MHLFFTTEKVHTQETLTFLDLTSHSVHWVLQNSEGIDSPIKIHDLATHGNQHSPQKDPHFLFHLMSLHQRHMKINLFKLKRPLRADSALKRSSNTLFCDFWMYFLTDFISKIIHRSWLTMRTIMLIPPQRIDLPFKFLNPIFQKNDSSLPIQITFFIFRWFFIPLLNIFPFLRTNMIHLNHIHNWIATKITVTISIFIKGYNWTKINRIFMIIDCQEIKRNVTWFSLFLVILIWRTCILWCLLVFLLHLLKRKK